MSLLQMSFYGSVMILAVIVLRSLFIHKLPKKTFLVLWSAAIIRLLIPFSLPSPLSIYSLIRKSGISADISGENRHLPIPSIGIGYAQTASSLESADFKVLMLIWIVGAVLAASAFFGAYLICMNKIKTSVTVELDIGGMKSMGRLKRTVTAKTSFCFTSPMTYGVIKPVILFPGSFDFSDTKALQYVLAHEYAHIRRLDSVKKLILILTLCVHWFNPLVWAMYIIANQDIELSCDEEVIRLFGFDSRKDYARTLVSLEETKGNLPPACTSFCRNSAEERIKSIMKYKKITASAALAAIALTVCFCTAFSTSAAELPQNTLTLDDDSYYSQFDFTMSDKNGNQIDVTSQGIKIAQNVTEGGDLFFARDKDSDFEFNSSATLWSDIDTAVSPIHTEEEMEQILRDIESGKIPEFKIPDDPNCTVTITDRNGNVIFSNEY